MFGSGTAAAAVAPQFERTRSRSLLFTRPSPLASPWLEGFELLRYPGVLSGLSAYEKTRVVLDAGVVAAEILNSRINA